MQSLPWFYNETKIGDNEAILKFLIWDKTSNSIEIKITVLLKKIDSNPKSILKN